MGLSTHVLDIADGRPGAGIPVVCHRIEADGLIEVASAVTDDDGRVRSLVDDAELDTARYRLQFELSSYLSEAGRSTIFPVAEVLVEITRSDEHHHVPLLLAGNGYTVYRGS